jgi:hypothetical protein
MSKLSLSVELQKFMKNWIHLQEKSAKRSNATKFFAYGGGQKLTDLCEKGGREIEDQVGEFKTTKRRRSLINALTLSCTLCRELSKEDVGIFQDYLLAHSVIAQAFRFLFERYWEYELSPGKSADEFRVAIHGWLLKASMKGLSAKAEAQLDRDGVRLIREHWKLPPATGDWWSAIRDWWDDLLQALQKWRRHR